MEGSISLDAFLFSSSFYSALISLSSSIFGLIWFLLSLGLMILNKVEDNFCNVIWIIPSVSISFILESDSNVYIYYSD